MGLLDDAIRQHLDLKRRRGADPAEVERAEREALGPVRRNREAPDASEPGDETVPDGLAYDQSDDEEWVYDEGERAHDEYLAPDEPEPPPLELTGSDPDRLRPRRVAPDTAPDEPVFDEPASGDPEPSAGGPTRAPAEEDELPPAPPPRLAHGGETGEYDVEEALAADDGSSDDMLEETPEFLQDTPDHDRLWFEQRPPKDFDFDG